MHSELQLHGGTTLSTMSRGVPLTVAFLLIYLLQASCHNFHNYNLKPKRCEVDLRIEPGWVCGCILLAEDGTPYASFKGIPYGKPPVGIRRFKELEPLDPWDWDFMLDATQDAPACPHADVFFGRMPLQVNGMSEDCDYLNLYVPYKYLPRSRTLKPRRGLPILVFIHGGAFQSGAGLSDILGPQYMVLKNIIIVTFNYRLNVFGFYSLNTIEIPGNQGLRDMVTCLRWVHRNARSFGGDPHDVTLMGHSAGATAAHILSLSKETKGLFKRIILMSGTAMPSYFTTSRAYAAEVSDMFLGLLGINCTDPILIHEELVKMPLLKLMQANAELQMNTGVVSFSLVVESEFPGITRILHKDPMTLISEGCGSEYPALISYTNNEAASLRWPVVKKNVVQKIKDNKIALLSQRLLTSLPDDMRAEAADEVDLRYFKGNYTLDNLLRYYTDMMFKHPALKVAEWRAAQAGAPTYLYQFAYDFIFSPVKAAHWVDYRGSAHMDDLACVFRINSMLKNHNIFFPPINSDDAMKRWMVYLIVNFMICNKPTCNNGGLWPPVARNNLQYNLITEPMIIQMLQMNSEERDMVKFFDSIDPESRLVSAMLDSSYE